MLAAFAIMCISREDSAADLVIPRVRTPDIVTLPTIELRAPVLAKVRRRHATSNFGRPRYNPPEGRRTP